VIELSEYTLETLRKDGEFILDRGLTVGLIRIADNSVNLCL
jgi:hypothetical protein